jgi:23S rRNA pseudouridine955/2504/2580 synthase
MVTIHVPEKYDGKKLDKFLKETFKNLPQSAFYKSLRNKDIRINGIKINQNTLLSFQDKLEIYIKDEILYGISNKLEIVYEDENLIIINKQPNISVEGNDKSSQPSLLDIAKNYLKEQGEDYSQLALCHRLDRNTGGLIILAKNQEILEIMVRKFKNHEIKKYYQCLVLGYPKPECAELKHYLIKDAQKSHVYIYDTPRQGSVEIITRYKVLEKRGDISLLEVELITGKTHQIRAHLAYIGYPIIGDRKYGKNEVNKKYKAQHQQLWAYKLVFDGKTFEVEPNF